MRIEEIDTNDFELGPVETTIDSWRRCQGAR